VSEIAVFADASAIDEAADPGAFVVLACERAKEWLAQAVEHGDIDQIVEIKSQAEAIRIYTTQKQLGKDAELSAAEIVRRAERGLTTAIRRGQEEGTVFRSGDNHHTQGVGDTQVLKRHVTEFASGDELYGGGNSAGIYDLTDNVDEETFEEAIDEAKAEGNLSRANVVRKVRGEPAPTPTGRPEHLRNMRHIDANRVVEQTVLHSGISESIAEQLDYSTLDRDRLEGWVISLSDVIRSLTTLKNNLKKEMTL